MDTKRRLRVTWLDGGTDFVVGCINVVDRVVEYRYQIGDDTFGLGLIPFTSFREVCEV